MQRKTQRARLGAPSGAVTMAWCQRCITIMFFVVGAQLSIMICLLAFSSDHSKDIGQSRVPVGVGRGNALLPLQSVREASPMVRGNLPASKLRGSRAEESARRVGGKENFLVGNGGRPPLPANAGGGGGRGGAGDGDRKRMHGWKFEGEPQFKGLSQQCGRRPLVIGGFTGSSTRLPMRVLQRAGVYMGPEELISSDADTLAWIRSMGGKSIHNQITAILDKTGSPAYEIEDIADASLQADIDAEYEVFRNFWDNDLGATFLAAAEDTDSFHVDNLCQRSLREFSWGWKGPRQMWFLPFIAKHFPNFHFVYAVRDVRDLLLQHTSFTEHDVYWLKSFFGGQGKSIPNSRSFSHAAVAQMWAESSLDILRWCQRPEQDGRCTIVRTQQLSGDPTALADFLEELDLIDPAVDGVHSFDDDELLKTLRKEVLGACLGSSSAKSVQHDCDQQSDSFSPNYRAWSKNEFYKDNRQKECAKFQTLLDVPHVKQALDELGFDADFVPAACKDR